MTDKTELEKLEKFVLDAKVSYKAAMTSLPKGISNNLDELEACNTTYAAWFKAELALSNFLKEQQDNG